MKKKVIEVTQQLLYERALPTRENTTIRERMCYLYEPKSLIDQNALYVSPLEQAFNIGYQRTELEENVRQRIRRFYSFCNEHGLATNNIAAFFSDVLTREQKLCETEEKKRGLEDAMICAVSGKGFVFGTAFDVENIRQIRPCDFYPVNEYHLHNYLKALDSHSTLANAQYFLEDLEWLEKVTRDSIRKGRSAFKEWEASKGNTTGRRRIGLVLSKDEIDEFLKILEKYALLQVKKTKDGSSDEDKIKKEFAKNRRIMDALMTFAEHCEGILNADTVEERKQNVKLLSQYLTEKKHIEDLQLIREKDPINNILDNDYFKAVSWMPKVSEDQKKRFVSLRDEHKLLPLRRDEKTALKAYKKHSCMKWILELEKSFSNPKLQVIAPMFITAKYKGDKKFENILSRGSFKLANRDTYFFPRTTKGDETQKAYERAHRFLYNAIEQWWSNVIATREKIVEYDKVLCDYIYDRNMSIVSNYDYRINEEDGIKKYATMDPMALILQLLDECLSVDISILPQYAKCRITDLQKLNKTVVLKKTIDKDWTVEDSVKKVIKKEDIEAYKNLAILNRDGIGAGLHTAEWHMSMAEWFDSILYRDNDTCSAIRKYCSGGNIDFFYPGTTIPISEINKSIVWIAPFDKLASEDFSTNLARVELAMQCFCCERIYAEMKQNVIPLFKRIFWADEKF